MKIRGSEVFIKALHEENVDTVFCYPGATVIELFDALYKEKSLNAILMRHEQALVHAADGYARSTGKVGVCLVTSGPGATNLVTGIATANYDSVPLVCFCGQVRRDLIGNDAFQEVDIVGITRGITKHSLMVNNRDELGRVIKEAFFIARTGKPGPVLVDLPSDMIAELGSGIYEENVFIRSYQPHHTAHIGQIKRTMRLLKNAKKPLFLAGGGVHRAHAEGDFARLVEQSKIPVVTTIMGRGSVDTDNELYLGNLGMHGNYAANHAVMECDVLCSIGSRFNDRITAKIEEFAPHAKIIHIDIDAASISRNVKVAIPIVADAKDAIEELLNYTKENYQPEWIEQIRAWQEIKPQASSREFSPQAIIEEINQQFSESIVVTDVGQHQQWTMQNIQLNGKKKLFTSGGLGTMGYGFPAAIGIQLGNPAQKVISISGDGGFQMNLQELATAVLEELPIITIIMNNGYLGMVRQWQKLMYDKHYAGTNLKVGLEIKKQPEQYIPDFIGLARSYGADGRRVTSKEELIEALDFAKAQTTKPTIIECLIDCEETVLPMVRPGGSLKDMIMEEE